MFVLKSTYEDLGRAYASAVNKYHTLLAEWNSLVKRINAHGGEAIFSRVSAPVAPQFTKEEVERLIRLCHPDKHQNSTAANEMTAKLLALKNHMKG